MTRNIRYLVLAAVLVLVATVAIVGVSCGSDDDSGEDAEITDANLPTAITIIASPSPGAVAVSPPVVTNTPVLTVTTVATLTSTATPQSTATPTPVPTATPSPTATPTPAPNANAEAGPDREISRGDVFTLNGSGSTDPDGDPIVSYTWTQVYGPDVTDGVGRIVGATPLITAPDNVSTVILELRVNDGHGDGGPDSIQINVMEHSETGFFVSGDDGSNDDGDGSRSSPFTSIPFAINQIQGPNYDIYVKSLSDGQSYLESETITPQTSISLYGGFGDNWVRDVTNNRTKIQGAAIAIEFGTVLEEAWFSGFDLTAADASKPGGSSVGVVVRGDNVLHIEDNTISGGKGAASSANGGSGGDGGNGGTGGSGSKGGVGAPNVCSFLGCNVGRSGDGGEGGGGVAQAA